jgi:hypothetical protein
MVLADVSACAFVCGEEVQGCRHCRFGLSHAAGCGFLHVIVLVRERKNSSATGFLPCVGDKGQRCTKWGTYYESASGARVKSRKVGTLKAANGAARAPVHAAAWSMSCGTGRWMPHHRWGRAFLCLVPNPRADGLGSRCAQRGESGLGATLPARPFPDDCSVGTWSQTEAQASCASRMAMDASSSPAATSGPLPCRMSP